MHYKPITLPLNVSEHEFSRTECMRFVYENGRALSTSFFPRHFLPQLEAMRICDVVATFLPYDVYTEFVDGILEIVLGDGKDHGMLLSENSGTHLSEIEARTWYIYTFEK